jgi:hypothetical protein
MSGASSLGGILAISFFLAWLVIAAAWAKRSSSVKANDPMDVNFDFQGSWLSTFTALVAILGTLNISGLAVSSDVSLSVLSLFFAVLVAVAPLVYKASGAGGAGPVGGFLMASGLTLWAAFGVIFAIASFLNNVVSIFEADATVATVLIMAVLTLTIPLIAIYAHGKVSSLVKATKAARAEATFL